MLKRGEGIDIITVLGGFNEANAAIRSITALMDAANAEKLAAITSNDVLLKIANAAALCQPDSIFINTGSAEDRQFVREQALKNGEESTLPMESHTIHYDLKDEQGRIIDRTFYIANPDEDISSLANKMLRDDAIEDIREKMTGIMKGMVMIVGFYMRGPVGAPVSNPAIEITSSAYVSHSAEILYRNAFDSFDREVAQLGYFFTNIHSQGLNRPEDLPNARVYMDRSQWTTYSFNCTYAGNTLLLKKGNHRFAVDKAVYLNRGNELAEHMFITGIGGPGGRITWFSGAAPSGCGKTTTAMAGDYFVGDDLAQMWRSDNKEVRVINPECGIFGIVEDVNWDGDPKLMNILRKPVTEVIWSNVLIDDSGVPHWTGNGETMPPRGVNYQGEWHQGMTDASGKPVPISHPNARCTVSAAALDNYSDRCEDPAGVDVRVVTYSGRDSDTMPPVRVAKNADHGVAIGACIVSAATATEVGASGVKRAPWANAPFIPGALGDYMAAQFEFFNHPDVDAGKRPILAGLNYFLTDAARGGTEKTLLGEKRDVRVWMAWLERCAHRDAETIVTPIGLLPRYEDLKALFSDLIDKPYPEALYEKQFSLYIDNILRLIDLQVTAYSKEAGIPGRLFEVLEEQRNGLLALKNAYGPVATPDQLLAFNRKA